MNFRQWRQFFIKKSAGRWPMSFKLLLLVLAGAVGLSSFQNCSKASSGGLASIGAGKANSLLASKPIPIGLSLNEVSYMSCPMAGATNSTMGDPLGNPFYRLRFGSFDNSAANNFIDPTSTGKTVDSIGGLSFTQFAMNYMRSVNPNPTSQMLANYLGTSPYTVNSQPVVALINQYRTTYSVSWTALATTMLTALSNTTLVSSLVNANQIAGSGTTPMGYFPALPNGSNAIIGSLNWGQSIIDESNFRTNLMNEYVFAGFAPTTSTDASGITQNLQGPDGSVIGRLFGLGYTFAFNYNDPSVANIYEWDLDPSTGVNPINLTTQNNQQWECFALTVVRDIDRKYWTVKTATLNAQSTFLTSLLGTPVTAPFVSGNAVHPLDVNTLGRANPSLQENYFQDGNLAIVPTTNGIPYFMYNLEVDYNVFKNDGVAAYNAQHPTATMTAPATSPGPTYNTNIPSTPTVNLMMGANGYDGGTYHPCPPEDPTAMSAVNLERLRIIRRFLPANLWEVNVSSMCAVPTATTTAMGSCYASGDNDQTKYIQYNGTPGSTCGSGMTECPAKVNFCWRYH